MSLSQEHLESRFIKFSDPKINKLVYPLPTTWWSRPYEYQWCRAFVNAQHTVLDAACGISHPFKFYLTQQSKKAYACDSDPLICSFEDILRDIRTDIGEAAAAKIASEFEDNHLFTQASITALPYEDKLFNTIFCISVLEHLQPDHAMEALQEFNRTLQDDGQLILTLDYPTVNLEFFQTLVHDTGFDFCAGTNFDLPSDALHTDQWGGLYCFRAALKKQAAVIF
ncbi:class I SAM-dependent methyltransferase [Paenibacillus pini]|uniref:Methyltransferase type 11 domain-containing protein n=1 Tax=Paenibacillus pini JCM 16418 TaxID=1236976 RepID=W7YDK2_9BACL|nr:class I SAM-dependent methyltransferase [Paenibacillus pini]GAF06532.1 hypothetical protein JCM16418_491 [Paenibacillus pini JCM 16418]